MPIEKTNYWIKQFCCMNNAYYNTNYLGNKKTHKVRGGGVWFKGEQLFGGDMSVTTRKFIERRSHWWVETADGKIIDWVINEYLEEPDLKKLVWDKKEIEALGFEYKYYENEVGIEKKVRKSFGKCGYADRTGFGEWYGSHKKFEREAAAEQTRCLVLYNKYLEDNKDNIKRRYGTTYGDGLPVMMEFKDDKWVDIERCRFK